MGMVRRANMELSIAAGREIAKAQRILAVSLRIRGVADAAGPDCR